MKTLVRSSIISIILLCVVATQLSSVASITPDYEFFEFVQRWPGAECKGVKDCCFSKKSKPAIDFGIHGLWPQYKNGSDIIPATRCDSSKKYPFNLKKLKDLEASLKTNWPSASCPLKESKITWEHQWVKHGTCSLSTLDQHAYFKAALKLKAQKNLLQILKKAGIEPNGNPYKYFDILKALREGTGYDVVVECNEDMAVKNIKQLYEVRICVNKAGSNFIKCPFPTSKWPKSCSSKNKTIKFPKYGPVKSELLIADA